jgi:hypothetical protein
MGEFARKGDPIWNWAARQFAGEYTGKRYYWNGDPAFKRAQCAIAFHHVPSGKDVGYVSVRNSDEDGYIVSPEQMWAVLIFELYNIRNDDEFRELASRPVHLSKAEFIRGCAQCEYKALQQLGPFYKKFVQPAEPINHGLVASYWNLDLPSTFDQWFEKCKKNTKYIDYYGYMYDKEIPLCRLPKRETIVHSRKGFSQFH